jgi:putative redox protein
VAHATARIGATPYAVQVSSGRHSLTIDEPASRGGQDAGPAPYEMLLGSLGACTAITLRMYADRKQWAFRSLQVDLSFERIGERGQIHRVVTIDGDLSAEQRQRLAEIAEKTPVTLTIKAGADIRTEFR